MNNFLGNLIDRHQVSSDTRQGFKVQPRPKARFERDPATSSTLGSQPERNDGNTSKIQSDVATESVLTEPLSTTKKSVDSGKTQSTALESPAQIGQRLTINSNLDNSFNEDIGSTQNTAPDLEAGSLMSQLHLNSMQDVRTGKASLNQAELASSINETVDRPKARSISANDLGDTNKRIKGLAIQLGRMHRAPQNSSQTSVNHSFQQPETRSDLTEESRQTVSSDNFSLSDGLNLRIQEILQRLHSQPITPIQPQNQPQQFNDTNSADLSHQALINSDQTLIQSAINPQQLVDSRSEHTQLENKQAEISVVQQAGLLQIPQWLTQMQTELNQRWQQLNTKVETEPVVNVSIGRIEVRAVQTETVTQSKVQKKPTGVMSLDNYLKQRESRERA